MQIQFNPGDVQHTDGLAGFAENEVQSALSRFTEQVTRVEIHIHDLNGPKSGLDKRCLMEVRLAGLQPLTVEADAAKLPDAITSAAGKLERLVESRLGRLHDKHRG